jgi:hypothetical protein
MMVSVDKPEKFSIFCKGCGSYEIDIWLDVNDAIVLDCQQCDTEEEI